MPAKKKTTVTERKAMLTTTKKSRALPPKELQAKRLKAIDEKIDNHRNICRSYEERGYQYTPAHEEYRKLLKQRQKLIEWDV